MQDFLYTFTRQYLNIFNAGVLVIFSLLKHSRNGHVSEDIVELAVPTFEGVTLACRVCGSDSRFAVLYLLPLYIVSLFFIFPLSLRSAINHIESCRWSRVLIVTVCTTKTERK